MSASPFVTYTHAIGLPAFGFAGNCSFIWILLIIIFLLPFIINTPEFALGRYFTLAIMFISSDFHNTAVQSHAKFMEYDMSWLPVANTYIVLAANVAGKVSVPAAMYCTSSVLGSQTCVSQYWV